MSISLFFFFTPQSRMGGSGRVGGDFGSVNGKKITQPQYLQALNEFKLFYLFHYGTWPDKKANLTETDLERETYIRLLLMQKAGDLGIHVGVDAAAAAASQMLRSLGRNGEVITPDDFAKQVLQPEGLTLADFEGFSRDEVAIQQLVQSVGGSGVLVTPQEAAETYRHDHQELSAQAVFFSARNYLSSVATTPEAVGQFYTNYLAAYRLPDRVQLNYVAFELSNFLAQSKTEWAKTNFDAQVDAIYLKYGAKAFPDAKTPDAAKAEIRDTMIRQRALADARAQANEFAAAVFNLEPARAENLATVAKQKGLAVHATEPFTAETGPAEIAAPEGFAKMAFGLSPDEPFANPVVTSNGVYVIAFARQLPSEIPPLASIRDRVTQDFQMQSAAALAREAGTNFYIRLTVSLGAGKSFATACAAAGLTPQTLPPFSLSTRELPALGGRAELNQVKQAAFTTPVGHASNFQETDDGGFIVFVQSQLPVDQAVMSADLPQFTETLRRARENEAFNEWLQAEAGRALRDTPLARRAAAGQQP